MNDKIEKVVTLAIIFLALALLFNYAFYHYEHLSIHYFLIWALSILMAIFSLYVPKKRLTWLFILIFVIMSIRALDPLSTPYNVISNHPDANYHYQIVQTIDENNRLIFSKDHYSGAAKDYYGYTMLELLLFTLIKVTGLNLNILVKYFGFALGFAALLFVVCYYKRCLGIKKDEKILMLSVLLFASCPWFIGFTARTVHLSLSFPLFILTLSMLLLPTRKASLIVLLLLGSTILTHHFMGFFLIVYITAYIIARYVIRAPSNVFPKKQLDYNHLLFVSVFAFCWAITIVPHTAEYISSFSIDMVQHVFFKPWVFQVERYTTPIGGKPAWMIIMQTIGYTCFLAFGLLGLMWPLLKKAFKKNQSVDQHVNMDTFALLLTAAILALPYWLGFGRSIDLMWRSLLFIFLALAPFTAKSLAIVNNRFNKLSFSRFLSKILIIIALTCIIQNAVYSGLSYYRYDPSAEMQPEDPRLNLSQWVSVAMFTKKCINLESLYGVRLAYSFVGSLAKKNCIQLAGDPVGPVSHIIEPNILANGEVEGGQIFILRKSLVTVPDPHNYTFSQEEMNVLPNHFNIIFQSQDAIIIMSLTRTHVPAT